MNTPNDELLLRNELIQEAERLGIPYRGLPHNNQSLMDAGLLQERIQNFNAARRSSRMWWFSLGSLIVSVISAGAAWCAVMINVN